MSNEKNEKNLGIRTFLNAVIGLQEGRKNGSIVVFGNGRNSTHESSDNVEITAESIRNLTEIDGNESED